MKIEIVKLGTETAPGAIRFYCGRGSILGNPVPLRNKTKDERDRVCDLYAREFPDKVQAAECGFMLRRAGGKDIELECFCQHRGVGKRCHCETIKEYMKTLKA